MRCWLYKLRFAGAVHFGGEDASSSLYSSAQTFCADTLFSALCHTAGALWGQEGIGRLCSWAKEGRLLLTDGMPWQKEEYYLPRPLMQAQAAPTQGAASSRERKALKALHWVPLGRLEEYLYSLAGGGRFAAEKVSFGHAGQQQRAFIRPGEDTLPYPVGRFWFDEGCGLWFLARCADGTVEKELQTLMQGLGLAGMGGRVSSGLGRFTAQALPLPDAGEPSPLGALARRLGQTDGPQLLLTTSLPAEDELEAALENACYRLTRRGGFVQSGRYAAEARKKRTQYFLAAGSVLACRFEGGVYEAGGAGAHPVLRYSRPILLGVSA